MSSQLTNINTKIIEGKLSKIFISEVHIKLVALRINRYTRSSSQFQKGWWLLLYRLKPRASRSKGASNKPW